MEAAAEGAVGLSEARDGSPLSVAAASDDGDTVVGVSYGVDAADMGTFPPTNSDLRGSLVCFSTLTHMSVDAYALTRKSRLIFASKELVG